MNIREIYIKKFFSILTNKEKNEIYFDQYMWHAFSYEKVECKKNDEAVEALGKLISNEVYIIFQKHGEVLEAKNITFDKIVKKIKSNVWESDCYIIDKKFKWTFVFTHETCIDNSFYIGPFFCEIS